MPIDQVQPNGQEWLKVPVVREEVQVEKRVVDTGRGVRIHKTVAEHLCHIDERLLRDDVEVSHVPVDRITRTRREEHHAETGMLKSEQVSVERFDEAGGHPSE